MTSKLTREQLHERARENVKALKMASRQTAFESAREEILADLQLAELALAAMDSEPVAWTWHYREQWHVTNDKRRAEFVAKDGDVSVLPLYRHAQPAPVAQCVPLGDSPYDVPHSMPSTLRELIAEEIGILFSDDDAQSVWDVCRRAAMLAAAPQSPGSEPATVPGKWIPVSERMPESNGVYFGWDGKRVLEVNCFFGGFSANQFIHGEITHWMPLPAPPTEVK